MGRHASDMVERARELMERSRRDVDAIGLANLRDLVDDHRARLGIEMSMNLDHSPSVESARTGIDAGFEFIHIDLSQVTRDATDDEIIAATREFVAHARTTGALVESEPHLDHDELRNLHGRHPVPKPLDLDVLQRIRDAIGGCISLHGGNGTPLHVFTSAAGIGVSKIDLNSDMRHAYRQHG